MPKKLQYRLNRLSIKLLSIPLDHLQLETFRMSVKT